MREESGQRDILVADIEELENFDVSEIHAKEMTTPTNGEIFKFPVADGTVKCSGSDQVFRNSFLIQDYHAPPARGEEHEDDLQGESDGSQPIDTMMDESEARNDFGSSEEKLHFIVITLNLAQGRIIANTTAIH